MIVAPALPGLSAEFGDTPNAEFLARLTLTMPALFVALSAPIFGLLLDRIGRRPILAVSVVVYLVSGTSGFFADSFIAILVGRAFLGLAAAGLMTGAVTVIADLYSGTSLNRFMGYQTAAVGLGGMLFLLVSGFLADIGWRLPFLLHLVALPVLPGVLLTIEEPRKVAVAGVQKAAAALAPFPWRSVAVIYATAPPMMFVLSIFPIQLPFYMTSEGGASSSQVGMALALQTLTSIGAALFYTRIKARLSFQAIFVVTFVIAAMNHFILGLSPAFGVALAGMAIGGLAWGMFPPNLIVWLASSVPAAARGRSMGGLTSLLFLGQFMTPIFSQPVVDRAGLAGVFWATGGLSLLIAAGYEVATVWRRGPRRLPDEPPDI